MSDRCKNCHRYARFIFLDEDSNCLACSTRYGFDDRERVFSNLVNARQGEYTWVEWFEIAAQLEGVDFGCRFDADGCSKRTGFDRRACCSNCCNMFGYLKTIPSEALEICLASFKRGNGFWTPQGCVLPWKYRSSTCMSYRCPRVRENEDAAVWIPFYKAVGACERQFLDIERLPLKCL